MIEVPTHEQVYALDLCFVSNSSFIRNINVLTKNEICSQDNFGITFELTSRAKIKYSKIFFWNDLNSDLNSVPWDQHIFSCDPNEDWSFFRNKLHSYKNANTKYYYKRPWQTPGLTLKYLIYVK